jgi:hypothetical protein
VESRRRREKLSRSPIKFLAIVLGTLGLVLAIATLIALRSLPQLARRILIAELEERFHSTIEIVDIRVDGVRPLTAWRER